MDHQLNELRERMHLLQQDRRANVEMLEAKKASNSEEISSLREENKLIRKQFNLLQKRSTSSKGDQNEVHALQRKMHRLRSELDSLKVVSSKHKQQLEKLRDESKTCDLEAKRPNQEDGPLSRKIRILENRLDKAMIKCNEAQSIRTTYHHIVKRLKEERISFENQLKALERTLRSKKRDHEELLILSGDASHAREVVQHMLHQSRCSSDDKRIKREGELRERQQVVKLRRQMIHKKEYREAETNIINESNLSTDEEKAVPLSPIEEMTGDLFTENEETDFEEQERKLEMYEYAFRKIKDATGVSDVNKVIEKITGQESTTENLVSLTKQNQSQLEELTTKKNSAKKKGEEKKYNREANLSRKIVDENKDNLALRLAELDRSKNKCERVANTLISAKSGVKHLQDKVEVIREELQEEQIALSDSTIVDILLVSGNIVIEILARSREQELSIMSTNVDKTEVKNPPADILNMFDNIQYNPFNQRVTLLSAKDEILESCSIHDEGYGDVDEEELSRDRVKTASTQMIQAQERKVNREKEKP